MTPALENHSVIGRDEDQRFIIVPLKADTARASTDINVDSLKCRSLR